jgi:hypothetical protein
MNRSLELKPKRVIPLVCIFAGSLFFTPFQSTEAAVFFNSLSWSVRGSILIIPEDNGLQSDPTPILPSPGLAAAYPLNSLFGLEVSLDFYATYYGYSSVLQRAVPYAIENRSTFVFGSILAFQGVYRLPLNAHVAVRFFAGPAMDLRLCLVAPDLKGTDLSDAAAQTAEVTNYFWGSGRWLFPFVGLGADYRLSDKYTLGFDTRLWFPLYRLWSGENLPAVEGWRFAAGLRLSFR